MGGDGRQTTTVFPTSAFGWVALVMTLIGLGSWVALPIITALFRDEYPVTDTYVMPVTGLALTVVAAVVNVAAVWRAGERSVLNLIAMFLTVAASMFFGLFVVGEWLSGV